MEGKVALVSGGTRGIGAAICRKLASQGYFVYINYRKDNDNKDILLKDIRMSGGKADLIHFDVSKLEEPQAALKDFKHNKLDLLVNNAGFLKDELIYKVDIDIFHKVLDTNYFGSVKLFEAYREKLMKSESPVVINMGSISGIKPRSGQAAYAVSKSMIIEWTGRMAKFYKNMINFYSVSPGPVNTEMIQETKWVKGPDALKRLPLARLIEPQEIAEIVYLLGTKLFLKNGFNLVYDGGFINTVRE